MPFAELGKCERGAKWGEVKNLSVSVLMTMPRKWEHICIYM